MDIQVVFEVINKSRARNERISLAPSNREIKGGIERRQQVFPVEKRDGSINSRIIRALLGCKLFTIDAKLIFTRFRSLFLTFVNGLKPDRGRTSSFVHLSPFRTWPNVSPKLLPCLASASPFVMRPLFKFKRLHVARCPKFVLKFARNSSSAEEDRAASEIRIEEEFELFDRRKKRLLD